MRLLVTKETFKVPACVKLFIQAQLSQQRTPNSLLNTCSTKAAGMVSNLAVPIEDSCTQLSKYTLNKHNAKLIFECIILSFSHQEEKKKEKTIKLQVIVEKKNKLHFVFFFFQYNATTLHKESMKIANAGVCNLIATTYAAIF